MMSNKETLTKSFTSDKKKALSKVIDFLNDSRYNHGEMIIKMQNGKPVFMEMIEKTKL